MLALTVLDVGFKRYVSAEAGLQARSRGLLSMRRVR